MTRVFFLRYLFVLFLLISVSPLTAQERTLSLEEAVSVALQNNADLRASQLEVKAREARMRQAGAIPNPDLEVYTEDVAGSGEFEGFENSQTTSQLSQRLELGGKRGARRNAALLNRDVATADLEIKRRNLIAGVRKAFLTVLLAQERTRWMQEILTISQQFSRVVVERIQAGKIPPIDELKAQTVVAIAEIDLTRATQDLASARFELAQWMGTSEPQFESLRGEPEPPVDLQLQTLIQIVSTTAAVKKAEVEVAESEALLNVERSKRVPDLTVTGGYRQIVSTGDSAFVAGVRLPIPLFDRNTGAIEEAQKRIQKSERLKSAVALQVRTALTKSYQTYSSAKLEAEALRSRVLPASQTTFDAISEGYRLGKFGYLDVLEAQRSLVQSRLQLLRAMSDIYESAAEIEGLTGTEILKVGGGAR